MNFNVIVKRLDPICMCYVHFIFGVLHTMWSEETKNIREIYSVRLGTEIDKYNFVTIIIVGITNYIDQFI